MKCLIVSTVPQIKGIINSYQNSGLLKGIEFSYLIEYFDSQIPTQSIDDEWSCKDFSNKESVNLLIDQIIDQGFDKVLTDDEYSIYIAAQIRERLNIVGPKPSEVVFYRDKILMKQKLKQSNVRIPIVYTKKDILAGDYKLPLVTKPRAFGGANGVTIFYDDKKLISYINCNASCFRSDPSYKELDEMDLQIEEYIDGDLFHIDGLVKNGELIFLTVGSYVGSCVDFQKVNSPLGSIMLDDNSELAKWSVFTEKIITGLDIPDGAFHLEAFVNNSGERVFLEIAARMGGASIMAALKLSHAIDLRLEHFLLQIGNYKPKPIKKNLNSGWLVFPKLFRQKNISKVKVAGLPGISNYQSINKAVIPSPGQQANGGFSYMNNNGEFLFCHKNPKVIKSELSKVISDYVLEVS